MESTWYDAVRAWNVEEVVVYDTSPRLFPVRSQAGSGVGASRVSCDQGRKTWIMSQPELRVALRKIESLGTDQTRERHYPEGYCCVLSQDTGQLYPELLPVEPMGRLSYYRVS